MVENSGADQNDNDDQDAAADLDCSASKKPKLTADDSIDNASSQEDIYEVCHKLILTIYNLNLNILIMY